MRRVGFAVTVGVLTALMVTVVVPGVAAALMWVSHGTLTTMPPGFFWVWLRLMAVFGVCVTIWCFYESRNDH